jgi:hypothetical protein
MSYNAHDLCAPLVRNSGTRNPNDGFAGCQRIDQTEFSAILVEQGWFGDLLSIVNGQSSIAHLNCSPQLLTSANPSAVQEKAQ